MGSDLAQIAQTHRPVTSEPNSKHKGKLMARPTGRRSTSVLPPIQPSLDYERTAKQTPPDIRVEEKLFTMFLDMRAERDYWKERYRQTETKFSRFRANRLATAVGRNMKPSPLGRDAKRGNL